MNESERLHQIHAYLDCVERHISMLPDKTNPDILINLAYCIQMIGAQVQRNADYSLQRRKDAAEARERVSAMIGTVN